MTSSCTQKKCISEIILDKNLKLFQGKKKILQSNKRQIGKKYITNTQRGFYNTARGRKQPTENGERCDRHDPK